MFNLTYACLSFGGRNIFHKVGVVLCLHVQMVRCVRFWRGEWKKNGEEEWEFVTHPEDFGYTVLINETASYEMVDMIIRQRYGLPYIPHL